VYPVWLKSGNGSAPEQGATSVLDQDCEFEGRLRFAGTLIVNGKFRGEIFSPGTLLIGETAEVEGDVRVGIAVVTGKVAGVLAARERVELRAGARVEADLTTPALVLEEGVVFDGGCKMRGDEVAAAQKSS
jgi:cytoskeletal protein CcmA (bactofilin family)